MKLAESSLSRLKYQHLVIPDLLADLSEEDLKTQLYPGKWSPMQQLAHLVSYHEVFIARIQQILENFNVKFEPYVAGNDAAFVNAQQLSSAELINELLAHRERLSQLLLSLDSGELFRRGFHPVYGNLTIAMWAEFFLLHEAHHIYSLFKMLTEIKNKV